MLEIKEEKKLYDTWENWCLRKLKELGRTSLIEWAKAMGYNNSGSMTTMVKRFVRNGKVIKDNKLIKISDTVIFTDHYV